MRLFRARLHVAACLVGLSVALLGGCAVSDSGYAGYGPGLGVDYYEPYGFGYGGWGPGYDVAPFGDYGHRVGGRGFASRGGGGGGHAFRPAAARAMPSIAGAGRGGGGRGGGGRGGGGRGGGGGRR